MEHKFTQVIKDQWIEALESGRFTQGYTQLVIEQIINDSTVKTYCCIGVLGEICDFLNNGDGLYNIIEEKNPYTFLEDNIGKDYKIKLWHLNDWEFVIRSEHDYSNVLPFIRELPVSE